MSVVFDCKELSFFYGSVQALKNYSLTVERGEVIALSGPNGAGKTTSIRVLTGLLQTSSGKCQVLGMDPRQDGVGIRAQSSVLSETPALYERLTGWQNLEFFGTLAGLPRAKLRKQGLMLLDAFKLTRRVDDRVETFSAGAGGSVVCRLAQRCAVFECGYADGAGCNPVGAGARVGRFAVRTFNRGALLAGES